MAKGRTRSRMELRQQYEAAEAREKSDRPAEAEDDEDLGDLDGSTAEAEPAEAAEAEEAKPAKKKKVTKKTGETKPRKKAVKVVRQRVVWVVLDNSNKPVAKFPYAQKKEAEEKAEQLKTDKKATYFVQPAKEAIE